MSIDNLTSASLGRLDDIYEFRAFTQLSYRVYREAVSQGYKTTAIIPETKQQVDQNALLQKFSEYDTDYLITLSFQHSVSIFESWFFDVLRELLRNPDRLNKKRKIDVGEIIQANSLEALTEYVIDSELNEVRYKSVADWFVYLSSFVNTGAPSAAQIRRVAEIKASRDILVHNSGIANQIYLSKAGDEARVKVGESIHVTSNYFNESWKQLRGVIEEVGNLVARKVDG